VDGEGALAKRLRFATLLAVLSDADRLELVRKSQRKALQSGELLWERGARPREIAFVVSGELVVERTMADGQRHVFRRYPPNTALGVSTIGGATHTADVRASAETAVLLIRGDHLVEKRAFVVAALAYLGNLVGKLSDDYLALLFSDIEGRVVRYLRQAIMDGRREIRKSQQELADEIGASRPNVARAIQRLKKLGAVRTGRGWIEILDGARLPGVEP
jgi:CRP-like cAMP-binding protein